MKNDLVQEFCDLSVEDVRFELACCRLAEQVKEGNSSLLELVERLQSLLVNSNIENRFVGTSVLSRVLQLLPVGSLHSSQVEPICLFFADRLNDNQRSIPVVLKGILSALQFDPSDTCTTVVASLFKNVSCQQQQREDRRTIYEILEFYVINKETEVLSIGYNFVYGLISSVDGERDPHNLLYLFQWLPYFLRTCQLGHLVEDVFEILACYFPVDFRTPSEDEENVRRDALAKGLCLCLCAVPQFAEFAFPLALEKLDSNFEIAKIDSLNLLSEGCKSFLLDSYTQHWSDLWPKIHHEILNSNDDRIRDCALNALERIVNKCCQAEDNALVSKMLNDIGAQITPNLLPQMKLFPLTIKLLCSLSVASVASCTYVAHHIIPTLVNTYEITETPRHKIALLNSICDLSQKIMVNCRSKKMGLAPYLCFDALAQTQNQDLCASGFENYARTMPLADNSLRLRFIERMKEYLFVPKSKLPYNSFLVCFKEFCHIGEAQEVLSVIKLNTHTENSESYAIYLNTLVELVNTEAYFQTVLDIFIADVNNYLLKGVNNCEFKFKKGLILIDKLQTLLQFGINERIVPYFDERDTISILIQFCLGHFKELDPILENNATFYENVFKIFGIIVGRESANEQLTKIIPLTRNLIFQFKSAVESSLLILLICGLLERLKREVDVPLDVMDFVINSCFDLKNDLYVRNIAIELLANILNKMSKDDILTNQLNELEKREEALQDVQSVQILITMRTFITKALIMRNHPASKRWLEKLFYVIKIDTSAVESLKILMNDDCHFLSTRAYCIKNYLFRQKLFHLVLTKLMESGDDQMSEPNYLLAFGRMMQETPIQILVLNFNKMLSVILSILDKCEDAGALCTTLHVLSILISESETKLENNLSEFIPRFLSLSSKHYCMRVRITALQCLQHFTVGYPLHKLLPHKRDIIALTTHCLDDRKRLVRKQAVNTHLSWIMLDSPI